MKVVAIGHVRPVRFGYCLGRRLDPARTQCPNVASRAVGREKADPLRDTLEWVQSRLDELVVSRWSWSDGESAEYADLCDVERWLIERERAP